MSIERFRLLPRLFALACCCLVPAHALFAQDRCQTGTLEHRLRVGQMPDVRGCLYADVSPVLRKYDHPAAKNDVQASDPAGRITNQQPPPNTRFLPGMQVTLDVSTGPGANPEIPPVVVSADVSVDGRLEVAGPYLPGQQLKFFIYVRNAGPSTATGILVDAGQTNLSVTRIYGACDGFPCRVVDLVPNASASIFMTATVAAAGTFSNSIRASHRESDPDPKNNTAIIRADAEPLPPDGAATPGDAGNPDVTEANDSADLSVGVSYPMQRRTEVQDTIPFTIRIHNNGPAPASNVRVTSDLANLTFIDAKGACNAADCLIRRLEPGQSVGFVAAARITTSGTFGYTVAASADQTDPDSANSQATASGQTPTLLPTPPLPHRPLPPEWGLIAIFLAAIAVCAYALTQSARRVLWRRRMKVGFHLDRAGRSGVLEPTRLAAPTVSILPSLEFDERAWRARIAVVGEETCDD